MKKINIPQERWTKFEQELVPIVFLSTIQVWWSFNFPAFIRLGNPLSTIVGIILSVVGILLYIYVFTSPKNYSSCFNLKFLDEAPIEYRPIFKNIYIIWLIIAGHMGIFFAWYKDIYHMSNMHYAIAYIYGLIAFILMARAANRQPEASE